VYKMQMTLVNGMVILIKLLWVKGWLGKLRMKTK